MARSTAHPLALACLLIGIVTAAVPWIPGSVSLIALGVALVAFLVDMLRADFRRKP